MKKLKFSFETSVSKKLNENARSRDEIVVPLKTEEEYGDEWFNYIAPFLREYSSQDFLKRKDLAVVAGFGDDIQYHVQVNLTNHKSIDDLIAVYLGLYARSFLKACKDPTKYGPEQTEYPLTISVIVLDNADGRFRIELQDHASKPGENVFKIYVAQSYVNSKKKGAEK